MYNMLLFGYKINTMILVALVIIGIFFISSSSCESCKSNEGMINNSTNGVMFANTQFKPECCPSAYSNSSGCACMSLEQRNMLAHRGGNNTPYSEY